MYHYSTGTGTSATTPGLLWFQNCLSSVKRELGEKERMAFLTQVPLPSIVYALGNEAFPDALKIGGTSKPIQTRISQLGVSMPEHPFFLVDQFKTFNWRESEKETHRYFAEFRRKGEFFQRSASDIAAYFRMKREEFQKEALCRMTMVRGNRMQMKIMGLWREISTAAKSQTQAAKSNPPIAETLLLPADSVQGMGDVVVKMDYLSEKVDLMLLKKVQEFIVAVREEHTKMNLLLDAVREERTERNLHFDSLERERLFLVEDRNYWKQEYFSLMKVDKDSVLETPKSGRKRSRSPSPSHNDSCHQPDGRNSSESREETQAVEEEAAYWKQVVAYWKGVAEESSAWLREERVRLAECHSAINSLSTKLARERSRSPKRAAGDQGIC